MTNSSRFSPFLVLCAALCFSLGGVLVKLVPWGAMSISAARSVIAGTEILIYMKIRGHKLVFNRSVLLGGAAMGLTSTLYVVANKMTAAANAILLQYTAPVFIIFLMWIIFGEKPGITDIVTTVILSFGVVLFFIDSIEAGGMIGNILALSSGVTYALVFMMKRFEGSDTLSSVFFGCVIGAVIGLPWLFGENEFTFASVGGVFLIGLVQFGLAYICMAEGLMHTHPLTASLISMIEPVLNPILAAIVIHERLGTLSLIGAAIVIVVTVGRDVIVAAGSGKRE